MFNMYKSIQNSLLGLYCNDANFIRELNEVQQYYDFYEGRIFTGEEEDLKDKRGQCWPV